MGLNKPEIVLFVRARLLPENMKLYGAYRRFTVHASPLQPHYGYFRFSYCPTSVLSTLCCGDISHGLGD